MNLVVSSQIREESSQIQVESSWLQTKGSQVLEENRQFQAENSQLLEENRQHQAKSSLFPEENRQFQTENSQILVENRQLQMEKTEEEGKQKGTKSGCLESMKVYLDLDAWIHTLTTLSLHGKIAGILLTINDSLADVVQADEIHVLYGRDYIVEELLGLKFKITPFSFFQTNSLGAEVLYGKAREYVGDTKDQVVFDLYSGTGTIAQMLAPVARKVVGVEIVEEAVEAAKNNAAYNGLSNCEFVAGDVLKVIDTLEDQPDLIVLDPPRDGIHPKALPKIISYGVQRIVYISCKPTSLTRDLVTLQAAGYRVEKACCVDMFPQTANVETVVRLHRTSL